MRTIREEFETRILDEVDVLVCGGGMTGFPAAIAASRNGARTVLAESEGSLGGTATTGLMNGYPPVFNDGNGNQVVGGIICEFTERLEEADGLPRKGFTPEEGFCKLQFDPEIFKRVAMGMVRESGVKVLLRAHLTAPLMEGNRVVGGSFVGREGRWGVTARTLIDATGDGSLAAWAGVPFDEAERNVSTLMFRICNIDLDRAAGEMAMRMPPDQAAEFKEWYQRHGTLSIVVQSDFPDIYAQAVEEGAFPSDPRGGDDGFDMQGIHGLSRKGFAYVFGPFVRGSCLDQIDTSRQEISAAERVWQQMELVRRVPGLENAVVVQTASALGVRGSRHLKCEYELTNDDVLRGASFPDAVGQGCRFVSWLPARERYRGKAFDIPYRALLPLSVEGLLVGGRSVSGGNVRGMVNCAVMGEACGTAASLCASDDTTPRKISVKHLQERLSEHGVILKA